MKYRAKLILYLLPIVTLPFLIVGFVVLVLTTKPPTNTQLRAPEAANTPPVVANGTSSRIRPDDKASGASDSPTR
jgi:hypothetical protein